MRWLRWLTGGLLDVFHRSRRDREAREEIALHLALRTEDLQRAGLPPEEARRIARAEFGSVASSIERTREAWGFRRLGEIRQDVRQTFRVFARSPILTLTAMLSVAIGIGTTSSIFSIADALLFRPLGIRDPGSLLSVGIARLEETGGVGQVSYPNYLDVRERARSFDGVIAYQLATFSFAASGDVAPDMRMGMEVSDNFFAVLGVPAAMGRTFSPDEGRVPDRDAVLVLGHDFWKGALGADPAIVGRTVWLNAVAFRVIGVAPERFTGMDQYLRPAFFMPATMAQRVTKADENQVASRAARAFDMRARLASGVSRGRAQQEADAVWAGIVQQYPDANRGLSLALRTDHEARVRQSPEDARLMVLLLAIVGIVLAIACANVANLLLGRARARSREMAVRLALGVGRSRLFRQMMTESALLSAGGCALGVLLALTQMQPIDIPTDLPVVIEPKLDLRFMMFTIAVTALSTLLFGIAPAWQSLRTELIPALKRSEPGRTTRHRTPGRNALVVVQIALSMTLLVAAGVLFDGFRKSLSIDPGFRTNHLLMMTIDTSLTGRNPADARAFYRNLVEDTRGLQGVVSVALTGAVPLDTNGEGETVVPEGYVLPPGQRGINVFSATISDWYFQTMGTDIVHGRGFTSEDQAGTRPVVVVNEQFAAAYWPGQNPIGRRLRLAADGSPWIDVVGVAKTGTYLFLAEPPRPFVYLPLAQHDRSRMSLMVQTAAADPVDLVTPLRDLVRRLDPNQPIYNVRTMSTFYQQRGLSGQRGLVETVGTMAGVGAVLALIGLYSVVAYSVACRTREIGIRIAVGAPRSDVIKMVLRQGCSLAVAGVVVGALGGAAAAGVLRSGLSGIGAADWRLFVVVPAMLILLTLAASYVPARRASLVDPLLAVRDE